MVFRNSKIKPNIEHLWILGCVAYAHINKQLHTKLDAKSTKCICIGYGDDCKAYCVWDPQMDQVYHSWDVTFDENQIGIKNANVKDVILLDTNHDTDELTFDNNKEEYDIEWITQKRLINGEHKYNVKWQGYDETDNTWEPYHHLIDTQALDEWEKCNLAHMLEMKIEDTSHLQMDPINLANAMN